jgi:outer membrane protein TolC
LLADKAAISIQSSTVVSSSLDARIDELSFEASSLAIKAERRRYFPEFSLSAGISRNFNEDNIPSDVQKSTTLAVSLPLFSRFQTESQINSLVKQQASEKSRAEYQSSENKRSVDFLIQDIKRLRDRLNKDNGISKLARDVMEKSREKFLQGKISANDFNTDESRYINLYDSWLKDMESLHKDFIVLCKNTTVDVFACVESLR